ncbi:MAG: 5'-3' exonuclease H3TH domain-containing protein, partial [Wujia sp.]
MNKILLVDGNSILNRAFYGLPDLTTGDGRHTNAVLGFLNIVLKVIEDINATHICVAFDVKHPTFRHEMYKEYKGTRKGMPDELREQVPLIKEVLHSMNIKTLEIPGYEADDIIGTMSRKAFADGYEVVVLSGDRDLLQLATDKILIKLPRTKGGKTTVEDFYAEDVKTCYGVDPITFIDMKGLMGDTSDNIPGVPGIGEKTASKLLVEYGSLDGIYEHIQDMKKSKMRDNLEEYKDQAYMSKVLATIKLDCELDGEISDMVFKDAFNSNTLNLFRELEFKSLLTRYSSGTATGKFDISYSVIQEYDDFVNVIESARKADFVSFTFATGESEIAALALMFNDNIFIIKAIHFITSQMLADSFKELTENNTALSCINIKEELNAVNIREEYGVFDCSIGAYLLNPIRGQYDYDSIAKDYLGLSVEDYRELVGKKNITTDNINDDGIARYLALKVYVANKAMKIIRDKLDETDMLELYDNIELPCLYTLVDMEKNGIRIDADGLQKYGDNLKAGIEKLTKDIYNEAGEEFNINSTKKLGEILFDKLKL